MSQFPHDQFAKDLLEILLSPFGRVETDRKISSEVREIDVCFFPNAEVENLPSLGLLSRLASTGAAFEPFRNPASADEIRSCMAKLFDLHTELNRQAKRQQNPKQDESQLTKLWILTPTLAAATLESFGAITDVERWGSGVYLMSPAHKTGIIVIHQLPETPDTLWLRILGKQKVQQRAIAEIDNLDPNSPYRQNALRLLLDLRVVLETRQNRNNQDTELLMSLRTSQPYLEYMAQMTQQATEEGCIVGERKLVLKQLNRKLGSLSPESIDKINNLNVERLDALGESLLDFVEVTDLEKWLG
jgi:Domain of unknown function (DUF4351)